MRSQTAAELSLVALALMTGCGTPTSITPEAPSAPTTGRMVFTIHWPARGRLVPLAAASLKFEVTTNQPPNIDLTPREVKKKVVPAPAGGGVSTVILDDLPSVKLMIEITAHPNADGTGVALAAGGLAVDLKPVETVHPTVTLDSTIAEVRVTPDSLALDTGGPGAMVGASAYDSDGNLVLTAVTKWHWTSADPSVATVTTEGVNPGGPTTQKDVATIMGLKTGSTTIEVEEMESGKTANVVVGVGWIGRWDAIMTKGGMAGDVGLLITSVSGSTATGSLLDKPFVASFSGDTLQFHLGFGSRTFDVTLVHNGSSLLGTFSDSSTGQVFALLFVFQSADPRDPFAGGPKVVSVSLAQVPALNEYAVSVKWDRPIGTSYSLDLLESGNDGDQHYPKHDAQNDAYDSATYTRILALSGVVPGTLTVFLLPGWRDPYGAPAFSDVQSYQVDLTVP